MQTVYDTIELGYGILRIFSEHGNAARSAAVHHREQTRSFGRGGKVDGVHSGMAIRDQHGRVYHSIRCAARAHGLTDTSVRRNLKGAALRCGLVFRRCPTGTG